MYVRTYVYVCMYACMYMDVCMYICMYVFLINTFKKIFYYVNFIDYLSWFNYSFYQNIFQ